MTDGGPSALLRLLENALWDPVEEMLDQALSYAERGWPILPCCWPDETGGCGCGMGHNGRAIGKAPLLQNGVHGATTDRETIERLWRRWPPANIGLALKLARLLALDLDGREAVEEALSYGLPPGPVSKTGRPGGEHRFYLNPWVGLGSASKQGRSKGIDIKVDGYVILPGSTHRSRERYDWLLSPDDTALQPAPEWVRDYLRPAVAQTPVTLGEVLPDVDVAQLRVPEKVRKLICLANPGGYPSRSEPGFAVIAGMVEGGHSDDEIAAIMLTQPIGAYVLDRPNPRPWLASEIARARSKLRERPHSRARASTPSGLRRQPADPEDTSGHAQEAITPEECLAAVHRWLLLPDDGAVKYLLSLLIANRLPGDPVWGLLVAPSGGAKTELLNALSSVPEIYPLSDLTPQTFVSGYIKDRKASLLMRLRPGTVLTLKDFTTVLQLNHDSRQQILSQLREIADGSYAKEFGTGQRIHWHGKIGFIAGVTPVIDQHKSVYAVLGERFVQFRPMLPERKDLARAARLGTGNEAQMRAELKEAVAGCIAGVDTSKIPGWPEALGCVLDSLATLCALARSGVVRDTSYSKDLEFVPEPEVPTRLVKQLVKIGQASALLRGANEVGAEDYALVQQVAIDTISRTRWAIIEALIGSDSPIETGAVATMVGLPTTTTKRHLEDLVGLSLALGDKAGVGRANKWSVSALCADLVSISITSPHNSPRAGRGENESYNEEAPVSHLTPVARSPKISAEGSLQPEGEADTEIPF